MNVTKPTFVIATLVLTALLIIGTGLKIKKIVSLKKERNMKTIMSILLMTLIYSSNAQNLSLDEIINRVEKNEKIPSSITQVDQTIITSKGKSRVLSIQGFSKNSGDDQFSLYTGPARVKGDKILMLNGGDDIWFYTPRTDRVRHLASNARKQKVQGSDFSYQDLEQRDYQEDFSMELLDSEVITGVDHYIIQAIPTDSGPDYAKLIFWVNKQNFVVSKVEYYEEQLLSKTLYASNVQKVEDYWIAMKLEMQNNESGSKTLLETKEIEVNIDLDDSRFSTNYLKRN